MIQNSLSCHTSKAPPSTVGQMYRNAVWTPELLTEGTLYPLPILWRMMAPPIRPPRASWFFLRIISPSYPACFRNRHKVLIRHRFLPVVDYSLGDEFALGWLCYAPFFSPAEWCAGGFDSIMALSTPFSLPVFPTDVFRIGYFGGNLEHYSSFSFLAKWSVQGKVSRFI